MEINWIILTLVLICAIVLIIYLVKRNLKDKKELTRLLNSETKIENELEPKENKE